MLATLKATWTAFGRFRACHTDWVTVAAIPSSSASPRGSCTRASSRTTKQTDRVPWMPGSEIFSPELRTAMTSRHANRMGWSKLSESSALPVTPRPQAMISVIYAVEETGGLFVPELMIVCSGYPIGGTEPAVAGGPLYIYRKIVTPATGPPTRGQFHSPFQGVWC